MTITQVILLVCTGLLAGLVSGTLGVGGAIVMIPMLVFALGLTYHHAQGTSLAIMSLPVFLIAAIKYYKNGYVNIPFVLIIATSFIVGSYIGSSLSLHLPDQTLRKIFGGFLILVGIKMMLGK
jgi:uncharacterized protein